MLNKNCGIYKITSPTGRVYIGQSRDIRDRWISYKKYKSKKAIQPKLFNSFNKYGIENHQFDIIEYCSEEDLNCSERFWQDEFDVLNGGLNCVLTNCGDKKVVFSKERNEKISNKIKGENHPFFGKFGKDNPNFGKKRTAEQVKNISESQKGKKASDETRKKLSDIRKGESNPFYGKTHSEESRKKISEGKIGKQAGEKHHMFGKCHSEETKRKIRETSKKRKPTKETIEKQLKTRREKSLLVENAKNIVLDTEVGVFYYSINQAANSANINRRTLADKLHGRYTNNTKFILV